jgi:hypothetical protein
MIRGGQVIVVCIVVGLLIASGCDKPSGTGNKDSSGSSSSVGSAAVASVDPKEVAVDPKKYVGKTLQSRLRLNGFGEPGCGFKDPINGTHVFFLKSPSTEMTDRLVRMSQVAGDYGSVFVTYKVDPDPSADGGSIGTIVDVAMK